MSGRGLINFDQRVAARKVNLIAAQIKRKLPEIEEAVERVNRRSLEWVQERAVVELEDSILQHGRNQRFSTGDLKKAIENPESHEVSAEGFRFMVDRKVRPHVRYYRAIDRGSRSQIGRRIVFNFVAGNNRRMARSTGLDRDPVMGVKNPRRRDAVIGPRLRERMGKTAAEYGNPQGVVIRNPVPAYHYSAKAGKAFIDAGMYKRYVKAELAKNSPIRTLVGV